MHPEEPRDCGRRAGIGKRVFKDYPGHSVSKGAVFYPPWIVVVRGQIVGRAHAETAHVVVVEPERRGPPVVPSIGLGSADAESTHHGRHQDD